MIKEIENIINGNYRVTEKQKMLQELRKTIKKEFDEAETTIKEGFKYCPHCKEYYRDNTFETEIIKENREICTYCNMYDYHDSKYEWKDVLVTYNICPIGHKIQKYYKCI